MIKQEVICTAVLQSCRLKDFAVTAAFKTIEEYNIICLSAEDQIRFAELLLNPPPSASAILKTFEQNRKLFGTN